LKELVHRPSSLEARPNTRTAAHYRGRPLDRITVGCISAGLSALLAWTAMIVPLHVAFISPTDQAIVWVMLAGWLGYWALNERRAEAPAISPPSSRELA